MLALGYGVTIWDCWNLSHWLPVGLSRSSAFFLSLGNSCSTCTSKKHNPGKRNLEKFSDCSLNFRLVKKLISEKSDWVPSSILQPAEGDSNNIIKNSNAGNRKNVLLAFVFSFFFLFFHTKEEYDKCCIYNSASVYIRAAASGVAAQLPWNLMMWVSDLVSQSSLPWHGIIVCPFLRRSWISYQIPAASSTQAAYFTASPSVSYDRVCYNCSIDFILTWVVSGIRLASGLWFWSRFENKISWTITGFIIFHC